MQKFSAELRARVQKENADNPMLRRLRAKEEESKESKDAANAKKEKKKRKVRSSFWY